MDVDALADKFDRIILDEAHYIRNLGTKSLRLLQNANATYRHCFTATLVCNSITNLSGYLAFLERPYISNDEYDRNAYTRADGDWEVNDAYVKAARIPRPTP